MISIRLPLALIITAILSIAAYFVDQAFSQSAISPFLAPIFVVLTLVLLAAPTFLSSASSNNVTTSSNANINKKVVSEPTAALDPNITTLYVGNLPYKANEISVKALFEEIGAVKSVRLMKDRKTGRRKGFGFVEVEAAKLSTFIDKLNDSEYLDRTIKVRPAKDKTE